MIPWNIQKSNSFLKNRSRFIWFTLVDQADLSIFFLQTVDWIHFGSQTVAGSTRHFFNKWTWPPVSVLISSKNVCIQRIQMFSFPVSMWLPVCLGLRIYMVRISLYPTLERCRNWKNQVRSTSSRYPIVVTSTLFLLVKNFVICLLICLCSSVAYIANNMDPDQTAPKGS